MIIIIIYIICVIILGLTSTDNPASRLPNIKTNLLVLLGLTVPHGESQAGRFSPGQ